MAESDNAPIRQSDLQGRLVIDIETTEEVGRLSQFLVDVDNHQIAGFLCKKGLLNLDSTPVLWVQVESIGRDSILVRRSGTAITSRLEAAVPLAKQAIWSDAGDNVGALVDYCLALPTGAITQYLFTAAGWQGLTDGLYQFEPTAVVSMGRKRIMVQQAALAQAPQYVPGLQDRVVAALQQDADQTRQDVQGVIDGTREVTDQIQDQAKKLTEQAKTQFGQVFGQVKQRSRQLRSQVNDRVADAASTLHDQTQSKEQIPGSTIDVNAEEVWPDDEP